MLNMMPKGESDRSRIYSPQRDLANYGGELVQRAVAMLMPARRQHWLAEEALAAGCTEEDWGRGVLALASGLKDYVEDPDIEDLGEALRRGGFFDAPRPIQRAVAAALGQVFLGALAHGIRDVTLEGQHSPQAASVAQVVEVALRLMPRPDGPEGGLGCQTSSRTGP